MIRQATTWAIVSGLLLGAFLLLRPLTAYFGAPEPLDRAAVAGGSTATEVDSADADRGEGKPVRTLGSVEGLILERVNEERRRRGLSPVKPEPQLSKIARRHSKDMIVRNFFSHVNPDALAPTDRIFRQHRRLIGLGGENIWTGNFRTDPEALGKRIMDGWMNSPGHRENILRSSFTHLGVGVVRQDSVVMATQNFAAVQAYAKSDVPKKTSPGEKLRISAAPSPSRADFWNPDRGLKAAGPFDPASIQAPKSPGQYRLRFYFSRDGRDVIYQGPSIEVGSSTTARPSR